MSYDNLSNILSFVEESLLRDQKMIRKLSDYSASLAFHEGDIREFMNVSLNVSERGSPAWLKVSRVTKTKPPTFPISSGTAIDAGEIAVSPDWIAIVDDPERPPALKSSIRRTLPKTLAERLLRDGKIRRENLYESATASESHSVAMLLLEDFPAVKKLFDEWIESAWAPWSVREKPIRHSATFYEELFKIHTAISGRDLPIEMVMGLGLVRGVLAGHAVDHPLIEYSVHLEVNPSTADILIRPRERAVELFDFETDDLSGDATALRREANSHWTGLPDHIDASPFERQHWERILRSAAHYLKDDGVFAEAGPSRRLTPTTSGLTVSDTWVLFTRPVSAKPMISDIRRLKDALLNAENVEPLMVLLDNPIAAEQLESSMPDRVSEMLADAFGRTAVSGKANWSAAAGSKDTSAQFERVAPYFPRVSNSEQARVVEILERPETKGLVVQGPPGTGKSHSIANIICHGLARGWRILVTAHSDGPLHVLRDMLPDGVRDLVVNLATGEQSEVLQLEASVKAISAVPGRVGDRKQRMREIAQIEQRILLDRERLAELHAETLEWARANLERVDTYAGNLSAGELAERIVDDRASHNWLPDAIPIQNAVPPLSEEEVARLRRLRAVVGRFLIAREWKLPELALLPTPEELEKLHQALREHHDLSNQVTLQQVPPLATVENGRKLAADLLTTLRELRAALSKLADTKWIDKYMLDARQPPSADRLLTLSVNQMCSLFAPLIEQEKRFVLDQVVTPALLPEGIAKCVGSATLSGRPYRDFAFLRPPADVIAALADIRIRGITPASTDDWRLVGEQIAWRSEILRVAQRWSAVAQMFGLEEAPKSYTEALQWMKQAKAASEVADLLIFSIWPIVLRQVAALTKGGVDASQLTPLVASTTQVNDWIDSFSESLAGRISQHDLVWAREKATEIRRNLIDYRSPCSGRLQTLLQSLGSNSDTEGVVAEFKEIRERLQEEKALYSQVAEIDGLVDRIESASAPLWAEQLRSIASERGAAAAHDNVDALVPAHWRASWIWSAWHSHLKAGSSLRKIRAVMEERARLDAEIRSLMNDVVRLRTELQLSRMQPSILTKLQQFQTVVSHIGAGTGVRAIRRRKEAQGLARECAPAVPCWIMPIHKVSETQPSQLGLFDLVIVDEASQCGPEAIMSLMRARKALIVGDDKQVTPTSFLSEEIYRTLKAKYLNETSYQSALAPGSSFYDLALAMFAGQNVMLREHFRCVEPIIRFSMQFYGQAGETTSLVPLKVPKASERLDPPLIDVYVPHGRATRQTNQAEAEVIVREIARITSDPAYEGRSIGVVSLSGSEQPELIESLLQERLGAGVFARHDIVVSDSSGLQGKERSIIFLSMVDAPNRRSAARTQATYSQRYNVALSRAKDRMYLVRSLKPENLPNSNDLRLKAIQHFADPMPAGIKPVVDRDSLEERCGSGFERQVLRRLLALGFDVLPQVPAAGFNIDLVVEGLGDRRLAIELDGDIWHPPSQYSEDLARQQALERIGFRFWRCWWSDWVLDPEACFQDLLDRLGAMDIRPPEGRKAKPHLFVEHRVADLDGSLLTLEEYELKTRLREETSEPTDTETALILLPMNNEEVSPASASSSIRRLVEHAPPPLIEIGDLVIVQCTGAPSLNLDGQRTFEIRPGAADDIHRGRVGIDSELGAILRDCLVDDCVSFMHQGFEINLVVVGVRKRQRLQIAG
jgi:very-short-patch-repair endonuclease